MTRDPILFRVDGTPEAGWERFNRCLAFAAALQRRRRPTYFFAQLEPNALAMPLKRAGNEWLPATGSAGTEGDLDQTIREVRRLGAAAVIVDSASVGENYLAELADCGAAVVSIDDEARIRFHAHVVINPLLEPGRAAYDVTPGTQILVGRRYALVRSEVRRVRPLRAQEPPQPFRGLIALGEDVPAERTVELARNLFTLNQVSRVDVLSRHHGHDETPIRKLIETHAERIGLAREPAEISARAARSHFAVTGGGPWSVELACIGVPQLMLVQAPRHLATARRLDEEGAGLLLEEPDGTSDADIRAALQSLLSDPLERQSMARCARKLIDGRGPDRLVTALEVVLHGSRFAGASRAA